VRNVIVTGASRGLGLAMTRRLVADGYRVLAIARSSSDALNALAETSSAVEFRPYDLSQIDGLGALVRQLKSEFGAIWGLVNNAGIGTSGMLANMPQEQIEALIRLNVTSPIMLTKFVARSMLTQNQGRIVNVSSIVASNGYNGLSVYSATKASLVGFTKSLAREMGRMNVTVNAVAPGFIDTDLTGEMDEAERERVARRAALKRMATAEDVAAAVAYLMGEDARNITGTVITIDAGATA